MTRYAEQTAVPPERSRAEIETVLRTAAYDSEVRRRWRSLALAVKAKLEVVATGISTFESEFLAHIVLSNGATVGESVVGEIQAAYETGTTPPLLLSAGSHE